MMSVFDDEMRGSMPMGSGASQKLAYRDLDAQLWVSTMRRALLVLARHGRCARKRRESSLAERRKLA